MSVVFDVPLSIWSSPKRYKHEFSIVWSVFSIFIDFYALTLSLTISPSFKLQRVKTRNLLNANHAPKMIDILTSVSTQKSVYRLTQYHTYIIIFHTAHTHMSIMNIHV